MNQQETPTNCRLFILGGKGKSEEEFREAFEKFGELKDVWKLKDKRTNEDKGVVYITFAKASMAALAREEMNGTRMEGQNVPLKVLIANDRREGSVREPKEEDKNTRIFIKIPRSMSAKDVEESFKEYGEVDHVNVLKEKGSGESKGLAYVKYTRAYHAALAMENCDQSYKAIFAARRVPRSEQGPMDMDVGHSSYSSGHDARDRRDRGSQDQYRVERPSSYNGGYQDMLAGYPSEGEVRLEVIVPSMVTQEQLFRLFDLIPGLDFCDLDVQSGLAYVKYTNAQSAGYARDKLNGFEYPPSYRLSVRFARKRDPVTRDRDYHNSRSPHIDRDHERDTVATDLNQSVSGYLQGPLLQDNIQTLVNSIKQATSVLQSAGVGGAGLVGANMSPPQSSLRNGDVRVRYCSIPLPEKKQMLSRDATVQERLFIVSQPDAFSEQVLADCFSRFGNLIDSYFVPGKNFGYAKYGDAESAKQAIETMHTQTVCGMRLKVMLADPPKYSDDYGDSPNKRPRS